MGFFGARGRVEELEAEVERLRGELDRLGALGVAELERRKAQLTAEIATEQANAAAERERVSAELAELRAQVVTTSEEMMLQEAGIYEYRHPLADAVAYQDELKRLREEIKAMTRADGGAVLAINSWTVNGSVREGKKMVRETSKLMLRAYNAEADNLVRGMKAHRLDAAVDRLTKVAGTIAKLGVTMQIRISADYHALRIRELELAADYAQKLAEEKEREREEKARLREEQKAQQEMNRERQRLEKERQHHENALAALEAKGDEEAAARLRAELGLIEAKIEDVDYRVANIRAGYVYVISNLGSFGENVVKVGMTRRLEPRDRIRELSDASVPFNFDVHALFFSKDAVGIEAELHRRLAEGRVNKVNLRREFFYATPAEVKAHLLELAGDILEYVEDAEAVEFNQSKGAEALPELETVPAPVEN